jgi:hypothetical protein
MSTTPALASQQPPAAVYVFLSLIVKPIFIGLHAYLSSFATTQQIRPPYGCRFIRRPWKPGIVIDDFDDTMAKHLVIRNGAEYFDVERIRRQVNAVDSQR